MERDPVERREAHKAFWQWFLANRDTVYDRHHEQAYWVEINRQVHLAEPVLWEVIPAAQGPRGLRFSAGGLIQHMDAVLRLAASAPEIPGWRILTFKPAREDTDFGVDGSGLYPDLPVKRMEVPSTLFEWRPNGDGIDIAVYVKGVTRENAKAHLGVFLLLLDGLLGEYTTMTLIKSVGMNPLDAAPPEARPLRELASLARAGLPVA
ncbi:MAG: hypothetical protein K1X67_11875 [Fimbriimonadaceae bacterium]|nr:hypothetical protein [Fimbriimonadaceae bacterium]